MGNVRIVSGKFKGRKITTPAGTSTRPLLSRLRKSLTDILRPNLSQARVLDLFGGSGAIAFEFLSNGAATAVIVEREPHTAQLIRNNAQALCLEKAVEVYTGDALAAITCFEQRGDAFDIIIVAPPYGHGLQHQTLQRLASSMLLDEKSIVVVQRDVREPCASASGQLVPAATRSYGRTVFDFYAVRRKL